MTDFLVLLAIVTGACALPVLADWRHTQIQKRNRYLSPWRDRQPGDLAPDALRGGERE